MTSKFRINEDLYKIKFFFLLQKQIKSITIMTIKQNSNNYKKKQIKQIFFIYQFMMQQVNSFQYQQKIHNKKHTTHIGFNPDQIEIESNISQTINQHLKRQNTSLLNQTLQKISKKNKTNQRIFSHTTTFKNLSSSQEHLTYQPSLKYHSLSQKINIIQQTKSIEYQTLNLLHELLYYPNTENQNILNPQIVNKWIKSTTTSIKLKSFLILYMILYRFDNIEFKFEKKTSLNSSGQKIIQIVQRLNHFKQQFTKISQYIDYKSVEFIKYFKNYLEWLIFQNQQKFQVGTDFDFWVMALNNCEKFANQMLSPVLKNQQTNRRNIFLSIFLMNAEDANFRRKFLQISKNQKNILLMEKGELGFFPQCHWLLGLNFSVRYFFQKKFQRNVVESLNKNLIKQKDFRDFNHEYLLLSGFYCLQQDTKKTLANQSLISNLLIWMAINSGSKIHEFLSNQSIKLLNKSICIKLMSKTLNGSKNHQEISEEIRIVVELLKRDKFLQISQKHQILQNILYKEQKIAQKLGDRFMQVINIFKFSSDKSISQFLLKSYNEIYSHLIFSQKLSIENNILAQLKHLINIKIQLRTIEIKKKIWKIFSSFNVLTHWNKNVLKNYAFILQNYIINLSSSFNIHSNLQSEQQLIIKKEIQKQIKQLEGLYKFVKIHLNLDSLNLKNLKIIINLINSVENNQTILILQKKTISFIKKDLLSRIFNKTSLNETLFSQIKKQNLQYKKIKNQIQNLQQNNYCLFEEIKKFAAHNQYFLYQLQVLEHETDALS